MSEDVPLNSTGAANIFLNTGKNTKLNSPDGTVIHLKSEKPADLGVHINTTFSVASSKKIRLLFVLNFLLSVICMILSCSIAFYYWNEMISMRQQLDSLKEQFMMHSLGQDKIQSSPLVSFQRPLPSSEIRHPRMEGSSKDVNPLNPRKYFVEDLGDDMLLVDSSKRNPSKELLPSMDMMQAKKELLIVQFNGAKKETHMGSQSTVGPWVRDNEISSPNSETKIELNTNYVTVQEEGIYLVYAQLVYLTQAPNCYFIFANQIGQSAPRLLTTCATGDDSSRRPLDKSQISCSVQTVARLFKGDQVNIAQREHNRTLLLKPGYSYLGFIKLSS
ncbi:hypothetical protein evm_003406 [Chilo suppressalis]|nr:hypothetical protein evm_003406 [Chilo suppressalis]